MTRPAQDGAPPPFDTARVAAALRGGDEGEIEAAYRQVFGGPSGRLVLAHLLKEAGVGTARPRDMGAEERAFMDGAASAALGLASRAGFDAASVVLAPATGQIEGRDDDRASQPRAYAVPDTDGF